jgi:hypothetical protein
MKTERLPEIPTIDPGSYHEILNEVDEMNRTGRYNASVCSRTAERTRELIAKKLPTVSMASIEKKQAELARQQEELEQARRAEVAAVQEYQHLLGLYDQARARLDYADQQMASEIQSPDDQRAYTLSFIGLRGHHFDVPGRLGVLFEKISTFETINREWPAMRQKLVDEVEAARASAVAHSKKWGIGETKPEANRN